MRAYRFSQADLTDDNDRSQLITLRYIWQSGLSARTDDGELDPSDAEDFWTFLPPMTAWLDRHVDSHLALLAWDGPRGIGMIWLGLIDRLPSPGNLERRGGIIQSFFVQDWARHQGIGRRLLDNAIGAARQLGLDWLIVHPSERSVPLYERAGFAVSDGLLELRP